MSKDRLEKIKKRVTEDVDYEDGEWLIEQVEAQELMIQKLNGEIANYESQFEYIRELVNDFMDTKSIPSLREDYLQKLTDFLNID